MLNGRVDVEAALLRRDRDRAARLDREVRDHRERVVVLDDEVGAALCLGEIPPRVERVLEHVAVCGGVAGADRRVLHEGRPWREGRIERVDAGLLTELDLHEPGGGLRRVRGLRHDGRHGLPVEVDAPRRQHGTILVRGPEPRHRRGQLRRGDDVQDSGHRAELQPRRRRRSPPARPGC